MRDRRGMVLDGTGGGEGLGGVGKETIIKYYCMRKKSIFNEKRRKIKVTI